MSGQRLSEILSERRHFPNPAFNLSPGTCFSASSSSSLPHTSTSKNSPRRAAFPRSGSDCRNALGREESPALTPTSVGHFHNELSPCVCCSQSMMRFVWPWWKKKIHYRTQKVCKVTLALFEFHTERLSGGEWWLRGDIASVTVSVQRETSERPFYIGQLGNINLIAQTMR